MIVSSKLFTVLGAYIIFLLLVLTLLFWHVMNIVCLLDVYKFILYCIL